MKCVQEELKRKTLVMFSYETPDRTHINIRLFDPDGGSIWNNSDTHRGSYAFTTKIEGDHKATRRGPVQSMRQPDPLAELVPESLNHGRLV